MITLTDEERSATKDDLHGLRFEDLRLSDADLRWWRDAKFGMFIHWGLYAIPGREEWHMSREPTRTPPSCGSR
ncbi:MAG: alpha-L-fucosidase [Verrucomicrobia bacterium]|nr:alpha-L-fucosidase [Verrucomicrobiota bacterium]MCH8527549.1 alpha-L-fucosidase [Kiritimatiellia bacterium]